jgi:hypothetical protein
MLNTTINFNYKNKKVSWTFDHNLDENGMSIESAFINWSSRLKHYQKPVQSAFCEYVISKDPTVLKCKISKA